MKYMILFFLASVGLMSCTSNSDKTESTDTITVAKTPIVHALCFLRTDGINKKDSTSIELVIKGNKVTGQMNWLPYQKDSRKGTLAGTLNNDTITATWSFMQEGMTDTLALNFKLDDSHLLQKPLKLNTQTGREQTDASADYTLTYATSDKIYK